MRAGVASSTTLVSFLALNPDHPPPLLGACPAAPRLAVSQIYCTHNLPSWSLPWQRLKQEQSTSTGFVIDGRRIITNAHSVEYSTMVQVRNARTSP